MLAALAFGAWYGNRQVWFLGTDDAGRVALYRGLPYELPFGIELYERALRQPDPDRRRCRRAAGRGHRPRPALARGRGLADRRHRTEPGDSLSSARNRELIALVPVALLLTAGFAAVFAQEEHAARQPQPDLRRLLPRGLPRHPPLPADPPAQRRPLPLPAGRAADRLRAGDDLPDRRRPRPRPGQLVRARARPLRADDPVPARLRGARALPLHDRRRSACCCCWRRGCRGSASRSTAPTSGSRSARSPSSRPSSRRSAIVVFLASYLREHREVLIVGARRVLGVTLPPLKHFGPMLVVWGASMFMLVFIRDLGSSLMFFAAFLALLYVATGRFSFVVIGMAMFLVGAWFFASTVPHVHDRVEIWLDPYAAPDRQRVPDPAVDLRPGRRRPLRQGLRPGADHDPRHRRRRCCRRRRPTRSTR